MSGWNQWVKWVAPFSMAQSFIAAATTSATCGIERLAPVDGPQQAPEDLLGQPLAHDVAGEDVGAEDGVDAGGHTVGRGRSRHRIEASRLGLRGVVLTRREINEETDGW